MTKPASTEHPIHDLLRDRWSPRAFSGELVTPQELHSLIEAARWAPSSMNEQPWSLIVGDRERDPEGHARILSTLVPANTAWAAKAPVLAIVVARLVHARNGAQNRHALYDTGQAMAQLAVEATHLGLAVHQMGGFDPEKAREVLGIPADHVAVAAMAIGRPGHPESLEEPLRTRELAPRTRRAASEWAFAGRWGQPV